ncbi:MAG: DUF4235 domain-containing protein [Cyclobacteriaceae bacterium]
MKDEHKWKILSGVLVMASGYIASRLVQRGWSAVSRKKPPRHPRLPTANLKTAAAVAAISGVVGTVVKFGITRLAGKQWQASGRKLPDQ